MTNYIPSALNRVTEMGTGPVWKRSGWFLSFLFVISVLISMLQLMDGHLHFIRSCGSTGALLQLFRIQAKVQELGKRI